MIEPSVILRDGDRPTHAVLAWEDWLRLREMLEDTQDAAELARALADPEQDRIPSELVDRLLDEGVHPVRAWRENRGLSQAALGRAAGLPQSTVARIESGERRGTVAQMRALAAALGIQLDTLVATLG